MLLAVKGVARLLGALLPINTWLLVCLQWCALSAITDEGWSSKRTVVPEPKPPRCFEPAKSRSSEDLMFLAGFAESRTMAGTMSSCTGEA